MSAPSRDEALRMWREAEQGEVGEPFAARIERFAALSAAAGRSADHAELVSIHRIMQSIGDCPPPAPGDGTTLKAVKGLCQEFNRLCDEVAALRGGVAA